MAEYLTASQYAERYGIDVQTVRRMCAWRIADHPPGGRASGEETEMARLRREVAALLEWKEKVCEVFSLAL